HQSPLYPGTGAAGDAGSGAGSGFTVNLPVAPRSGDAVFLSLVAHVVVPLARSFAPQLVLVSAGYDAHRDDPLADCTVTEEGYAAMARAVQGVCAELGVPFGFVLEGGYALEALARSVAATLAAVQSPAAPGRAVPVPEAAEALKARERLARWWPALV
ncbi:MAG TPA: histone deacetylase, partial [Solirubrobacteraceae bacterium]|nr:histone deacetylase [Solirubrobacteraceae bacterium]